MGSRKDIIKRHLGITEYPWSSDDELEEAPLIAEESNISRPSAQSQPTMPDAPGTSGMSSSQHTAQQQHHQQQQHRQEQLRHQHQHMHQHQMMQQHASANRREQARMDRDLFWSIVNSPFTVPPHSSRGENQMYVPQVNHVPAPELRERNSERNLTGIQRMLAFKRLTGRLGPMHRGHIAGVIPVARMNPGVIVPSEANSSFRRNRHTALRHRMHRIGPLSQVRIGLATARSGQRSPSTSEGSGGSTTATRGSLRRDDPDDDSPVQPPQTQHRNVVTRPDREVNNNPRPATADLIVSDDGNVVLNVPMANDNAPEEPGNHGNALMEDGGIEDINLNINDTPVQPSAANEAEQQGRSDVRAEESTEEVPGPSAARLDDPTHIASSDPNVAFLSNEDPEAGLGQTTNRSVKKRKPDHNGTPEPYSVKEFNQNLLRLLECPVCLEWMEPPISQCRRGHLVCGRCRARLASCPVCRTTFSSVRNRAMEGVAEMLRYPCRHGCGREVRLRRRASHEASCGARKYQCPAPPCAALPPLPRDQLAQHFQNLHLTMLRIGRRHKFSMKVNSEQHENWLILAMEEYFHLKIDVDVRTWGVVVYVSYIGPKCEASNYSYEVIVEGRADKRRITYTRCTHSDLESSSLNVCRQDCFHLTLDQALNFIRLKTRHCDADKLLEIDVVITKNERPAGPRDDSDS